MKLTPRLLIPKIIRPGKRPIGSSILRTLKNTEFPYGSAFSIRRNCCLASSLVTFSYIPTDTYEGTFSMLSLQSDCKIQVNKRHGVIPTIELYRARISNSHSRLARVIAICLGKNRSRSDVQSLIRDPKRKKTEL